MDMHDFVYEVATDWLWDNGYRVALESPEEAPDGMLRSGLEAFKSAYPELADYV